MKLADIFTDHMVLQAGKKIVLFGTGKGEGKIEFLGKEYNIHSGEDEWSITLPPEKYCGPVEMKVILNGKKRIIRDIYIGEVWFAGGQSNMEMPLFRAENGFDDAKKSDNNMIRFYTAPRRAEKNTVSYGWHFEKTISDDSSWKVCCEETALHFSAIGFYIAQFLHKRLNIAVGVISCNWGGREIECFIKREYFCNSNILKPIIDDYNKRISDIEPEKYKLDFKNDLNRLKKFYESIDYDEVEQAREIGLMATSGLPGEIPDFTYGIYDTHTPGSLYDSMIEPIVPFQFKGVMWYQGETANGCNYYDKCKVFIQCMRDVFKDAHLPFYIVELASFHDISEIEVPDRFVTDKRNWAFTREDQQRVADEDENAHVVTSMGLGDLYDIHPPRKKELSKRITKSIMKYSYGAYEYADHPRYESVEFKDGKAYVTLKNADGLFAKRLGNVKMYIADESKQLKRAIIEICNNTLVLYSDEVANPQLVRYGFDCYYSGCHIYNKAGLPLAPFRTDKY